MCQADSLRFNRGKLLNVGFIEAMKDYAWDCFVFHDVDLLPEDDRNLYSCPGLQPRHMSVAVSKWQYKLPYNSIFGGVVAINTKLFRRLNGFSNSFWGWGGEDDDMAARIKMLKLKVERYSSSVARYTMIKHSPEEVNEDRMKILNTSRIRIRVDGIRDLNYTLLSRTRERLYTNISAVLMPSTPRSMKVPVIQSNVTSVNVTSSSDKYTAAMREAFEKMPIFWKLKIKG